MSTCMDDTVLKSVVDAWVQGGSFPGAVLGVYDRTGKEQFYHEVNCQREDMLDKVNSPGYNRQTIFRIYSMTKPVTAVAIMILVDRGLVSLSDPVSKFIPSFENSKVVVGGDAENPLTVAASSPMTVENLLTHTSGLGYALFGNSICDQLLRKELGEGIATFWKDIPLDIFCERIAKCPLNFHPGTHFEYGFSFEVLGRIVEVVSKQSLREFFMHEIFAPLGMKDTDFYVPPEKLTRLAKCYEHTSGHTFKLSVAAERSRDELPVNLQGGGGLVGTLEDYAKFALCLLNDGEIVHPVSSPPPPPPSSSLSSSSSSTTSNSSSSNSGEATVCDITTSTAGTTTTTTRLLSKESMALMKMNRLRNGTAELGEMVFCPGFLEVEGGGFGFGLGMSVITRPAAANGAILSGTGEFGWGGYASTWFYVDPDQGHTLIFLTQMLPSSSYPIRNQLRYATHRMLAAPSTGSTLAAASVDK